MEKIKLVCQQFCIAGTINEIKPFGEGLINSSYRVTMKDSPDEYVLQKINHHIFRDVEMLQNNIYRITSHIRRKLEEKGEADIDRKVLTLVETLDGKLYNYDSESYWRMTVLIPQSRTFQEVNAENSYYAGKAFGHFQSMLAKFNVWIFPEQLTTNPMDFIQSQQNGSGEYGKNFTLNNVSYLIFLNPQDSPQSFAYPANVQPGVAPIKAAIVFGSATVTRYATVSDGMSVVAHELGHSLFNLRDEYVRTGTEFGDRYGHNIARNQTEAQSLWGDVVGQIDPFYFEWKSKMQSHNVWIDKNSPVCYFDAKRNIQICSWYPDENEIKVGYYDGGGITTTGISVRPTYTSLMSNEDVRDKSWPRFPPVFGISLLPDKCDVILPDFNEKSLFNR